jgi:chorismate dehydratase
MTTPRSESEAAGAAAAAGPAAGAAKASPAAPAGLGSDAPVRVGRIEFVNCYPLYDHFAGELAARGVAATIVEGYPAVLNRLLVDGEIDVTLPSSIEFARHAAVLELVPQVSISSLGAVDSVQLFTSVPLAEVRTIALTEKSATSVCLLRVLCREWGLQPEFAPRRGSFAEVLKENDGLLLIGDEALHVLRAGFCPYNYDLGEEWRKATGLPMVFAVCAARADFVAARPQAAAAVGAALLASRDRCAAHAQQTAAAAALRYDFSQAYLMEYFDKLKFGFTPEYRAGLQEFYRRAVAIGELECVPDLAAACVDDPVAGGWSCR